MLDTVTVTKSKAEAPLESITVTFRLAEPERPMPGVPEIKPVVGLIDSQLVSGLLLSAEPLERVMLKVSVSLGKSGSVKIGVARP